MTPVEELDVVGDINFTGMLKQNGTPFTGGGVWTTSGSDISYSGGKVGIGTTSPSKKLEINVTGDTDGISIQGDSSTDSKRLTFGYSGNETAAVQEDSDLGGLQIMAANNRAIQFFVEQGASGTLLSETSEAMRIAGDGKVGIGTTSPNADLHVSSGTSGNKLNVLQLDVDYAGGVGNGGLIKFRQVNGFQINQAAIYAEYQGNWGSSLNFMTRSGPTPATNDPDDLSNLITRMTIDETGKVGIGTESPTGTLTVGDGSLSANGQIHINRNADPYIMFQKAGTNVARIQGRVDRFVVASTNGAAELLVVNTTSSDVTGTHGSYHVASDIRLKKEISPIPNPLEKVLALRGVNFKWNDTNFDGDSLQIGLIAQEVEKIVPEIVHTADDKIKTKAVEYQYLVALLIEAVKEQQKVINEQNSELTKVKVELSEFAQMKIKMAKFEAALDKLETLTAAR